MTKFTPAEILNTKGDGISQIFFTERLNSIVIPGFPFAVNWLGGGTLAEYKYIVILYIMHVITFHYDIFTANTSNHNSK